MCIASMRMVGAVSPSLRFVFSFSCILHIHPLLLKLPAYPPPSCTLLLGRISQPVLCPRLVNMRLVERFWATITYVVTFLTLSPVGGPGNGEQTPLLSTSDGYKGPIFKPPGGRLTGPGSDFLCDYSNMPGWQDCSALDNRCWLRNPTTGQVFNISTNYESIAPIGITRHYELNITESWINADGMNFTYAKIFNGMYPGPWIQACWGDTLNITVRNRMKTNGTSIHWHGIRQNLTMFASLSFKSMLP